MEPAKIRIRQIWTCHTIKISTTATAIQLSYLKLNSYKQTSSE